jgi:hypothetical protein
MGIIRKGLNILISPIEWTEDNVTKLLACNTQDDFMREFPGRNIETLKRRQREFRKAYPDTVRPFAEDLPEEPEAGSLALTGNSGVIKTGAVAEPITDWTETLKLWGLDPEVFEVIQPVTMKAWGTPGNFRYSYAARIQKKAETETPIEDRLDLESWRQHIQQISFLPTTQMNFEAGLSYLVMVADPQLGKPGTQEALDNWTRGIQGHCDRINHLIDRAGLPINKLAIAFMGDEHEGAVGNYASQPYEVELNYSDQVVLDFDMRTWSIAQLLEFGLPIDIASVPSNHGEHTRFGSNKALTSIYDNSSTMVARLVQKVFNGKESGNYMTWDIATDRQDANLELSGIKVNFTHGHVSHGSGSKTGGVSSMHAIEKQILGRTEELVDTKLYVTAHYHHFNVIENRGRTFFGCPALEAEKSSQWFYDSSGVWSKPGMLGMVVGKAAGERGWSELDVI